MLRRQGNQSPLRNFVLLNFGEFQIIVLSERKLAVSWQFNGPEVLTAASDKVKLFTEIFSERLILLTQLCLNMFS